MKTQIANTTDNLRLIVMSLGQLTLACRIEAVFKVVNYSQIHSSGLGHTGVTYIDNHAVVVVDLYQRLFKASSIEDPRYFVIVKPQADGLVAIPVTISPNLVDVPREHIRVLPESYRQSDTLAIASHIAVIPDGDKPLTVFVLDENTLL